MEQLHRIVHEHRRLLASVFTGLAVLAGLTVVRQAPAAETILVARHDLRSGQVLEADDLRGASVPPAAVPDQVLDRDEAIGRRVAGPIRRGEALTDFRIVGPGSLAGHAAGAVFTVVRVDRSELVAVGVGDRVDVVAVDPDGETAARIVARDVEVVTVPETDDADDPALGVVTDEKGALALATAGLSSRLSVITASTRGTSAH